MKKSLISFGALALVGMAGATGFAKEFPDAQTTLPASMGWMQGFPPAQEKRCMLLTVLFLNFRLCATV